MSDDGIVIAEICFCQELDLKTWEQHFYEVYFEYIDTISREILADSKDYHDFCHETMPEQIDGSRIQPIIHIIN